MALEDWIWYTTTNKINNNKNPRQIWNRWSCPRCVERSVRKKEVPLVTRVLMQSCRFLHDPQRSQWGNVLVRLVSRNEVFIEFWTCHQWYSISNNPDGMSLCSTSLLGVYYGRRWIFLTCTCLRKIKEYSTIQIVFVSFRCCEKKRSFKERIHHFEKLCILSCTWQTRRILFIYLFYLTKKIYITQTNKG